jgi:hypothetical protein
MIIRYKKHLKLFCSFFLIIISNQTHAQTLSTDSLIIRKIFDEALLRGQSYEMLDFLSNKIGGRLSGSPQAAAAVDWSRNVMKGYNFDTVYLQEVMVPRWIRGEKEEAGIINLRPMRSKDVPIAALGGSIATPKNGLTAKVVEVHDFEALKKLGTKNIQGKIVFFNRPMDARSVSTFEAYGGAVDQRGRGAAEAAKYGAVGVIVRSMSLFLDDYPHTGAMNYEEGVTKIPAGAISTNAAELLSSLLKEVPDLEFYMKINSYSLPDVLSHNVVGEIRGTEKPDEIIVVGGHLDSWDLGDGAHDDGAGCIQSIEALRLFKVLGIRPKRTIRAVMFMNEENGLRGGLKYAELAQQNNENHIAAIESDAGGFTPRGFGIDASEEQIKKITRWNPLFVPYGLLEIGSGYGGADISPLKKQNTVTIGLKPDSQRYFYVHHAETDTFEQVNRRELELGAAAMASLLYLLSEYGLQ